MRSDAFSLRVLSMLNFGLNIVVEDAAALVLDYRDGGFLTGSLRVEVAEELSIFVVPQVGVAALSNTAPITGEMVRASGVYYHQQPTRTQLLADYRFVQ